MAAARVTGTIVTVDRKTGPVLYLKARDVNGRQIKRRLGPAHEGRGKPAPGTWTRKQAEDKLRDLLTDLGRTAAGPVENVPFSDAVAAWLRYVEHDRKRRPSTVADYKNAARTYLIPAFGDRPLHDITAEEIDQWRAGLVAAGHLSDRTINKLLALLHGIFKRAQRVYGLTGNPAAGADRQPYGRHGDIDVLEPGDVTLVASKAPLPQDAAMITVAAFTGLRLGELLALRWRDVDFSKRIVHVRWSYVGGNVDRPKSHRVRSVPMIDQAARALDGLSRRERWTDADDLVFVNAIGGHVDGVRLGRRFREALEAAGLQRLRWHDLRHVFGSMAVQVFPLTDVKAYMGHADVQTTMVYVHHVPQHDAAAKLSRLVDGDDGLLHVSRAGAQLDR